MITWKSTETALEIIRKRMNQLHEIGEKNLNEQQKVELKDLRTACVQIGDIRYELVRRNK